MNWRWLDLQDKKGLYLTARCPREAQGSANRALDDQVWPSHCQTISNSTHVQGKGSEEVGIAFSHAVRFFVVHSENFKLTMI